MEPLATRTTVKVAVLFLNFITRELVFYTREFLCSYQLRTMLSLNKNYRIQTFKGDRKRQKLLNGDSEKTKTISLKKKLFFF